MGQVPDTEPGCEKSARKTDGAIDRLSRQSVQQFVERLTVDQHGEAGRKREEGEGK